jgi:hypothetical protein
MLVCHQFTGLSIVPVFPFQFRGGNSRGLGYFVASYSTFSNTTRPFFVRTQNTKLNLRNPLSFHIKEPDQYHAEETLQGRAEEDIETPGQAGGYISW